jgi:hypothetical protein
VAAAAAVALSRVITSYYGARSFLLRRAIISLYFTQLCAALFDNSDYRFLDASKVSAAPPSQRLIKIYFAHTHDQRRGREASYIVRALCISFVRAQSLLLRWLLFVKLMPLLIEA